MLIMWQELLKRMQQGDVKALARSVSFVENEQEGYEKFLQALPFSQTKIIGITGPPGAGKSTLVDSLIGTWIHSGKKIAVICIDPSSPFNLGAVLGDRIRMSRWYTHPDVFIRSLATKGSLGGLHPKIIEITDLLKAFHFDHIIVETVGIGQSEIEIAGLADVTVLVLVPEAGDEVQTMKAGVMEVADIFVVNKADRPDAQTFVKNLETRLHPLHAKKILPPVITTIATQQKGIERLYSAIESQLSKNDVNEKKIWLYTEKAWQLIQQKRMSDINRHLLMEKIDALVKKDSFNLYTFVEEY